MAMQQDINAPEESVVESAVNEAGAETPAETAPEADLFDLSIDLPECTLEFDLTKIDRALESLIENAVKYAHPHTPIAISAEFRNGFVYFCVADHGPGIDGMDREEIFDRFVRVDNQVQRTTSSGLGLAITKQLCEAYGWRLTLANTPGGGLTVLVEVSAAPA